MRVVATAGHVDHGKSTLLRALTGMEPDRWEEERQRGLTIDLGFVWTDLASPDGNALTVAFVDVPGHERFIGNMLAGAGAVDDALFVVAADAGWSPQSSEHLEILDLLEVRGAVVAVTKARAVDPGRVAEVVDQVRARLAGTSLADAPVVETDAVAGIGVDVLAGVLADRLSWSPPRRRPERPRLWVDRSFAVSGAGTVVTGTVWGGPLAVGDAVVVLPAGTAARVRGLQCLGRAVDRAAAGSRVAVNLSGVSHRDIGRGDALVRRDHAPAWVSSQAVAVGLRALSGQEVANRGAWHLHVGSAEVACRVFPHLGVIEGGEQATARLELAAPLPLQHGDRFVLRESGRRATVAGGMVLDPDPGPRVRGVEGRLDRDDVLQRLAGATEEGERLRAAVDLHGGARPASGALGALGLIGPPAVADPVRVGDHLVRSSVLEAWLVHVARVVGDAEPVHGAAAAAVADALREVDCPAGLRRAVVDRAVADGRVVRRDAALLAPGAVEQHDRVSRQRQEAFVAALGADPLRPPEPDPLQRDLGLQVSELQALLDRGDIVRAGDLMFTGQAVAHAVALLREQGVAAGPFTASEAREAWGTSRKYAVPLLEHLTATGWTRFDGEHHRLRPPAA